MGCDEWSLLAINMREERSSPAWLRQNGRSYYYQSDPCT